MVVSVDVEPVDVEGCCRVASLVSESVSRGLKTVSGKFRKLIVIEFRIGVIVVYYYNYSTLPFNIHFFLVLLYKLICLSMHAYKNIIYTGFSTTYSLRHTSFSDYGWGHGPTMV